MPTRSEASLWSALTCQRFGGTRLVAATVQWSLLQGGGIKPIEPKR
ncbi:MAG: hypothetical protein JWM21_237 [Acidobacteria bacterium]|nr:hypothetical protein [Acidobacteriota bacterium]